MTDHWVLRASPDELYWCSWRGWVMGRSSAERYASRDLADAVRADLDTDRDVVAMRIVGERGAA
jgi:hypothetical protein